MTARTRKIVLASFAAAGLLTLGAGPGQGQGQGQGQGNRPPGGETAGNNLSYPVVWSDLGETVDGWVYRAVDDWTTATITDPAEECYPEVALNDAPCWHQDVGGEGVTWWLQQREDNAWQATNVAAEDPFVVAAIDWADLLESRTNLNMRSQIRTEVVLYAGGAYDPADFEAFRMSAAVPGTENSPNEMRGTNLEIVDPSTVHSPFHATVYSACARFLIQRVTDPETIKWSGTDGYWVDGAEEPAFDGAVWSGAAQSYAAEVNVGGNLIYGYNWNVRKVGGTGGTYRLTFVLEESRSAGGECPHTLNTFFDGTTTIAYVGGTVGTAHVVPADDESLDGDAVGGLTYIDVEIMSNPGGGRGPRR